jgi:ribosomal protein S18 acetylase RimI-like enzyme
MDRSSENRVSDSTEQGEPLGKSTAADGRRSVPELTVSVVMVTDEQRAIDTVVLAFAADPVARWSWPDAHQYLTGMPQLTRAFGGRAFQHQGAHATAAYAGAALWLPPGVTPDEEALGELVQRTVSASIRDDVFSVFEQMAKYHPTEPHWYLPLIGVDPAHQGKGHGDALLKYALEQCDRDHLPAYLESTNPRNISLYRRHGFESLGTIQVGSSPPLVPMLRRRR